MSEVKEIFSDKLTAKVANDQSLLDEINSVYQFEITGDEECNWVVDLKEGKVTEGTSDSADCTITVDSDDFKDIVSGTLPGPMAFMSGKLKIQGDMGLAMKLGQLLG